MYPGLHGMQRWIPLAQQSLVQSGISAISCLCSNCGSCMHLYMHAVRHRHIQCHTYAAATWRLQGFLRNYARGVPLPETGADDKQADCVARLAPLVAMFAGGGTPWPWDLGVMRLGVACYSGC